MSLIYILEDDESVRELEMYAVSGNGYEVEGFAEPKSFYSALERRKPDLLVIDVMLPVEDGLTITKRLRKNSDYRDMPIIMVTAKDSEMDYVKGLDCGADDYITKPFSVMIFLSRIKALLRRTQKKDDRTVYEYETITLDDKKHRVYSCNEEIELTFKEFEISYA